MKKIHVIMAQTALLIWFFLDMTGFCIGGQCLVTASYREDGIFFLMALAVLILFIAKEKAGKWLSAGWLSLWLFTQFINHEWYTIFGDGFMGSAEGKIRYFSGTMHWLTVEGRYIPDIYHTVLHLLIVLALTVTIVYIAKKRRAEEPDF